MNGCQSARKLATASGDAGGTVITCLIMNFLTFFYTDVFGLTPALVGTLFIALRVFDAISDPVMGVIADRTQSRWGRFRPWQLWVALPIGDRRRADLHRPGRQHGRENRLGRSAPICCFQWAIPPSTCRIAR